MVGMISGHINTGIGPSESDFLTGVCVVTVGFDGFMDGGGMESSH